MKEELITWKFCQDATGEMLDRLQALEGADLAQLDSQEGIYLIAFTGKSDDGAPYLKSGTSPQVVYVGLSKVNSSRHFQSGNTGTSTLRRSLGALLQSELGLTPVPRSQDPIDVDRYDNYMFDDQSEEKLTEWMQNNLKFAFLKVEESKRDAMLKAMIAYNVPIFNFQNNPDNKYGAQLKVWRKRCAAEAKSKAITA